MSLLPNGAFFSPFPPSLGTWIFWQEHETQGQATVILSDRAASGSWRSNMRFGFVRFYMKQLGEQLGECPGERRQGMHVSSSCHMSIPAAEETQWRASLGSPGRPCEQGDNAESSETASGPEISMRFGETSDMVFLNDLGSFGFFKKCAKSSFFKVTKSIPQASTIQQPPYMTPTKHAALISALTKNPRGHATLSLGLHLLVRTTIAISSMWCALEKTTQPARYVDLRFGSGAAA